MISSSMEGSGDASLRLNRETFLKRSFQGSQEVESKITSVFCGILRKETINSETYKEALTLMAPKSRRTFFQIEATEEEEREIKALFIDNFKGLVDKDLLDKVEKEISYGIDVERKISKMEEFFRNREIEKMCVDDDRPNVLEPIAPKNPSPSKSTEKKNVSFFHKMRHVLLDILSYIPIINVFVYHSNKR